MHPLDTSLALQRVAGTPSGAAAAFMCRAPDRYKNAIGPFGGWIAALLLQAVLRTPDVRGAPLALDAQFMGGMDDEDLEVRVYLLRQNRTVGFWRSEVWQSGRFCSHAQVTMSAERRSMTLQDARVPDAPHPDTIPVYTTPRKPVPWLAQYVYKPVGGLMFSRAETMDSQMWVRDAELRPLDALSLTALCDTPFPSPWLRLAEPIPVSTVTYSVYFRGSAADVAEAGTGFLLFDTKSSLAQGGYVDQYASVWSGAGRLLAQTQQLIWFADPPAATGLPRGSVEAR